MTAPPAATASPCPSFAALFEHLLASGRVRRHRRLLVLSGTRAAGLAALAEIAVDAAPLLTGAALPPPPAPLFAATGRRVRELLGTSEELVALDLHAGLDPDQLGVALGVVRGPGVLVLLAPADGPWGRGPGSFSARLAAPPHDVTSVGRRFEERLRRTLVRGPNLTVVGVPASRLHFALPPRSAPAVPDPTGLPAAPGSDPIVRCCRTPDQAAAVRALRAALAGPVPVAAVLSADRGRGKSGALGLAAAAGLAAGECWWVTAPSPTAAAEIFSLAQVGLDALRVPWVLVQAPGGPCLEAGSGGAGLRYVAAAALPASVTGPLLVDEAAALPVATLRRLLSSAEQVAFATTVHGYEGTGRGFDVRFRADLQRDGRALLPLTLHTPVRWGEDDPLELWGRSALLLDARPASDRAVRVATAATVCYAAPDQDWLAAREATLAQAFGLLTQAHYRTTPADLARLLDAPNLQTHLLTHEGAVVAVALVAGEGRLGPDLCSDLYLGRRRLRGHMLPECLVSHLGHVPAGALPMARVVRVAVHPALRRRGLGTLLLDRIASARAAAGDVLVGTGFAAAADLIPFWAAAGYRPVRLGLRRSRSSGEHAVIMLRGLVPAGETLTRELSAEFAHDTPWILADGLRDLDPDVAMAVLTASHAQAAGPLGLEDWRALVATAFGHRVYDGAARLVWALVTPRICSPRMVALLSREQRRRLFMKVVQRRRWSQVAAVHGESVHASMRALRAALRTVVRAYCPPELQPLVDCFSRARAPRSRG